MLEHHAIGATVTELLLRKSRGKRRQSPKGIPLGHEDALTIREQTVVTAVRYFNALQSTSAIFLILGC